MGMQVTLNIFSGLPNPVWKLSPAQESELLSRLMGLQSAHEESFKTAPGLGYGGFVVRSEESPSSPDPIMVYDGLIQHGGRVYMDTQRDLERWLLNTSGSSIPEQLRETISGQLEDLDKAG